MVSPETNHHLPKKRSPHESKLPDASSSSKKRKSLSHETVETDKKHNNVTATLEAWDQAPDPNTIEWMDPTLANWTLGEFTDSTTPKCRGPLNEGDDHDPETRSRVAQVTCNESRDEASEKTNDISILSKSASAAPVEKRQRPPVDAKAPISEFEQQILCEPIGEPWDEEEAAEFSEQPCPTPPPEWRDDWNEPLKGDVVSAEHTDKDACIVPESSISIVLPSHADETDDSNSDTVTKLKVGKPGVGKCIDKLKAKLKVGKPGVGKCIATLKAKLKVGKGEIQLEGRNDTCAKEEGRGDHVSSMPLPRRRGRWSSTEDDALRNAVQALGVPIIDWTVVAKDFFRGSRNHIQCKYRWKIVSAFRYR